MSTNSVAARRPAQSDVGGNQDREAVREYIQRREDEAAALRAEIETRQPRISLEELLARRAAKDKVDAAAGG